MKRGGAGTLCGGRLGGALADRGLVPASSSNMTGLLPSASTGIAISTELVPSSGGGRITKSPGDVFTQGVGFLRSPAKMPCSVGGCNMSRASAACNAATCVMYVLKRAMAGQEGLRWAGGSMWPLYGATLPIGSPPIDARHAVFLHWRQLRERGARQPPPLPTRRRTVRRLDGDADISSRRLWELLEPEEAVPTQGGTESPTARSGSIQAPVAAEASSGPTEAGTDTAPGLHHDAYLCRFRDILMSRGAVRTLCNVLTLDFTSPQDIRETLRWLRKAEHPANEPAAQQEQSRRLCTYLETILQIRGVRNSGDNDKADSVR